MKKKKFILSFIVISILGISPLKSTIHDDTLILKKNIIGIEFGEIPKRNSLLAPAMTGEYYHGYGSIYFGRNIYFKGIVLSGKMSFMTYNILSTGFNYHYQRSNDTTKYQLILDRTQAIIHKYYVTFDCNLFIKQLLNKKHSLFLYEGIGISAQIPVQERIQQTTNHDTLFYNNNIFQTKTSYILNSTKWEKPYYPKITGLDDINKYVLPFVNIGLLSCFNKWQLQSGISIYYLTKPYRLYSQDIIMRINLSIWI